MLIERTFTIGGLLVLGFGVLLAVLIFGTDAWRFGVGLFLAPVLMIGFGVFFLFVGRQARTDRQALLAVAEPPGAPAPPTAGSGRAK